MDKLRSLLRQDDPLLKPVLIGNNQFPGIWAEMMPKDLFTLKFPAERQATCMSCPKACFGGFRADYRCCTYHPRIANFLLGLGSETPEGDAAIDRLLDLGMLTPEGMYSTPGQWIDFLDDQHKNDFGRSEKVLCPMLNPNNGFCDVHAFRNSVCSTFFCLSDHGQTGESFWVQVQTLGSQIELVLAQWSLRELGFPLDDYIKAFDQLALRIHEVSTPTGWTKEALDLLWGQWRGREKQLMRECAALIVENRERLWDLANRFAIVESRQFDEAMDTLVPDYLEDEVEAKDDEMEEDGDELSLRPDETWEGALEAHERLWNLPREPLGLSPKVSFEPNLKISDEERFYSDRPYFISYRFAAEEDPQWRLACTQAEKDFLQLFEPKTVVTPSLFKTDEALRLDDARTFLSEAINRRMLWPLS